MASVRQINGRWQVQIRRAGVRCSRTFANRAEAMAWVDSIETPLKAAAKPSIPTGLRAAPTTFGEVMERYIAEESPKHKGGYGDRYKFSHLLKHWIAEVPCQHLKARHLAAYRDERLQQVKPGTVRRELNQLRPMLDIAREEWGAALEGNPARQVSVRVGDDSREGRLTRVEWQRFLGALKQRRNPEVLRAVELALETSMRRSELLSLRWEHIDLETGTAHLAVTKNGHPRTVALSPRAIELLLAGPSREGPVLHCSGNAIKCAFSRAKADVGFHALCFHQTRHEAISRMWELGLNETEIANQSGHRDWKMLRRYSHVQAQTLAEKLQALQQGHRPPAMPSGDG